MNFRFLFIVALLCHYLVAGTPPVKYLKCRSTKIVFAKDVNTLNYDMTCYGEGDNLVIPNSLTVNPPLPQGITLLQGEGMFKSKLVLHGVPKIASPWKRYKITASNNGNKIKGIPAAVIYLDICVREMEKICYMDQGLSISSFWTPDSYNKLPIYSNNLAIEKRISFDDKYFVVIHSENGQFYDLTVIDATTEKILKVIALDRSNYLYRNLIVHNGSFYFCGLRHEGEQKYLSNIYRFSIENNFSIEKLHTFPDITINFEAFGQYLFLGHRNIAYLLDLQKGKVNEFPIKKDLSYAVGSNNIAFIDKKNNKIIFINNKKEINEIIIQGLSLSENNCISFSSGLFYVDAVNLITGDVYVVPIDLESGQKKAILLGNRTISDMAHGDGFLVTLAQNNFLVFDVLTRKLVYSYDVAERLRGVKFFANCFLATTTKHWFYFNTGAFRQNLPPRKIYSPSEELEYITFTKNVKKNILMTSDTNYTVKPNNKNKHNGYMSVVDSSNGDILRKEVEGYLAAIGKKRIAIANEERLKIYDSFVTKVLHERTFFQYICGICYYDRNFLIFNENNSTLTVINNDSFVEKQVDINYTPLISRCVGETVYFLARDDQDEVIMCYFNVDDFIKKNTLDIESIPLKISVKDLFLEMVIGESTILIKTNHGDHLLVDIANKKTTKFMEDTFIKQIVSINQNRFALSCSNIDEEAELLIVNATSSLVIEKRIPLTSPHHIAYGNNCIALLDDREQMLELIDLTVFSKKSFFIGDLNSNFGYIYFVNDKFILPTEGRCIMIDSIYREMLGSFSHPHHFLRNIFSFNKK